MKVSLYWINQHLKRQRTEQVVTYEHAQRIAALLSQKTAEIDGIEEIRMDPARYTIARLRSATNHRGEYYAAELDRILIDLPESTDRADEAFLFYYDTEQSAWRRARYHDIGANRDGLIPALNVAASKDTGAWKAGCAWHDIRFTIDNKAITHRPDLWCHRGFAREIAPLLGDELIAMETLLNGCSYTIHEQEALPAHQCNAVTRLGIMALTNLQVRSSSPEICLLLARMDTRSINSIVDCTNYIMFDIGQPLHAFDADRIDGSLEIRYARKNETLTLLDGTTLLLSSDDCVVADHAGPLSVTGIMGGARAAVTHATRSIIIEAAHCNPYGIRMSTQRHKMRTESSTRFEKGTDASALEIALALFGQTLGIPAPQTIALYGAAPQERHVLVSQQLCQRIMGMDVAAETVTALLSPLGYQVTTEQNQYTVTVPSWRMADVQHPEDIVEDIARQIGYDTIPQRLPQRSMEPIQQKRVHTIRAIKQHLAYGAQLQEVCSYPFFDEELVASIGVTPHRAATIRNPLSTNSTYLITSLIPQLLQCMIDNSATRDHIRLFEIGKTWNITPRNTIDEIKTVAILLYTKKGVTFAEGQAVAMALFDMLRMPIRWNAPDGTPVPNGTTVPAGTPVPHGTPVWYRRDACAELSHDGRTIGFAGLLAMSPHSALYRDYQESPPFIMEIMMDALTDYQPPLPRYRAPSKYQSVQIDISLLAPPTQSSADYSEAFLAADQRVTAVALKDTFEHPDWHGKRSLTFRITLNDATKTMTSDEINGVIAQLTRICETKGATIRS